MKKLIAALAVAATALMATVTVATEASAVTVQPRVAQSPNGYWNYFGHFDTSDECNSFGQNGVNDGAWPKYECDWNWGEYDLYVWVN